MFAHSPACFQILFVIALLLPVGATAQTPSDDGGFASVGDFPWVGWHGPLSDGLHGLRFGTTGFMVNRVMREKGLEPSNARPYTLRFGGKVLGEQAELLVSFTTAKPSAPNTQLRAVQIRWVLRGLLAQSLDLFGRLDSMLSDRYGTAVHSRQDAVADLEAGSGNYQRLYYGPEATAWLELAAQGHLQYALLIRIECPQLPDSSKSN